MKRFQFSLQALQTLRQRREQTALAHYAKAIATRQKALDSLNAAEAECHKAWRISQQQRAKGAAAGEITKTQEYCHLAEEMKRACELLVAEAQKLVDQAWTKLVAARQSREAVDKFYRRQRERYDRELQRDEQKMLDELAQRRVPMTAQPLTLETGWN